jgi:hypothetical protein
MYFLSCRENATLGYQFLTGGIKKDFACTSIFAVVPLGKIVAMNYVEFTFLAEIFRWLLK